MNGIRTGKFHAGLWLVAIAITLQSRALHGRMSQRWGAGERMELAIQKITDVPGDFGNWQQEETLELSKTTLELLSCRGYLHRSYRNRLTGKAVKVAVMVGPGAKMSIHVPEICYEASNFTLLGDRQLLSLDAGEPATRVPAAGSGSEAKKDEFWSVSFQLNDVSQQRLEVAYAWSLGDAWTAPQLPRWTLGAAPVLYKIQASHVQDSASSATDADNASDASTLRDFLRDFVPMLRESLVPQEDNRDAPRAAEAAPAGEPQASLDDARGVELRPAAGGMIVPSALVGTSSVPRAWRIDPVGASAGGSDGQSPGVAGEDAS